VRDTRGQLLPLAITLVWLAAGVPPAAAEWFADLYGGAAFTENNHFSLDGHIDGVAVAGQVENVRYDPSFSVGGRGGYWFESFKFFGLGLDVDHFRPDISSQTAVGRGTITDSRGALLGVPINVSGVGPVKLREVDLHITTFAFDLMLRWPMLEDRGFPNGRLQPYVMGGPALFLQHLEGFDTRPTHGAETGSGVFWAFTRNFGLFSEYRYTYVRAALNSGEIVFRTHLSTHQLLGGVSFRF